MAKKTPAGTNVQKVAQQNNASAQNLESTNAEFASETDVSAVRQKNQKSQQNKKG
ncbi:Small acid-soluble spore protein [[Clostridium] ultunense Esp]|uniref:gamma-type small acid-soluble spore protein n=1 Tax=Thermicanus aegyptius TaxID=94009 RepID=UPI0002B6FC5E|nr:gamma-type small acid-soluble spore protein [Thermicanus aegyptius]CCQ94200.1 Small acid-soluble spore protein [[Clostridium] ultunense Esp]